MKLPVHLEEITHLNDTTSVHFAAFKALCILEANHQPNARSGGFDADDLSMSAGRDWYWKSRELQEAMHDLEEWGAVRSLEAEEGSAWLFHWRTA